LFDSPRITVWCALTLLVALALAGCGGASGSSSTATTVAGAVPGTAPHLGLPADAGRAAHVAEQFAGRSGERKFQALANEICGTVRAGSPPSPPQSPKPAALHAYVVAATQANRRTIISLQRLGAPRSSHKEFKHLLSSLRQLQAAYIQAGSGQADTAQDSSIGRSIAMAEARAGSASLANGVPACAPHLPRTGAPARHNDRGRGR